MGACPAHCGWSAVPSGVDTGRTASLRRLDDLAGQLTVELGSAAIIDTGPVGPFSSVSLVPRRADALGVRWLQSDVEVIVFAGSGGRWELEPTEQDMDLLEDLVRSVIAGRATEARGRNRARVEVTLSDGTVEPSTVYEGLRGLLPQRGWPDRRHRCAPYQ